jgi:hypothetical protein
MDVKSISVAYQGIKGAVETIKAAIGTKYQIAADAKIIGAFDQLGKAQDTLFELRDALSDLQDENRTLKDQLRTREDWSARAEGYEMFVAPGGAAVWRAVGGPVQHYVCPVCFEAKRIHFLQDTKINGLWECPSATCKALYAVGPD